MEGHEELSKVLFGGKTLKGAFPHTQEQVVEKFERRPPWMKPSEDSEPEGDEEDKKDPERHGAESDDDIEARVEGAAGKPEVDAPAVEAPDVDAPAVNAPKGADDDPFASMTLDQLIADSKGEGKPAGAPPAAEGAPPAPAGTPPAPAPSAPAPDAQAPAAKPPEAPAPAGAGQGIDTSWADQGSPGDANADGDLTLDEVVDQLQGGQSTGSQPWDSAPRSGADVGEAVVQAAASPDLPDGPHPADPDLDPAADGQVEDPADPGALPAPGTTTVGQFLSSQIHASATLAADRAFGAGYMTERERIALSGALARALQVFGHTMAEEFPEIAARQMPSAVALQAIKSREG